MYNARSRNVQQSRLQNLSEQQCASGYSFVNRDNLAQNLLNSRELDSAADKPAALCVPVP